MWVEAEAWRYDPPLNKDEQQQCCNLAGALPDERIGEALLPFRNRLKPIDVLNGTTPTVSEETA